MDMTSCENSESLIVVPTLTAINESENIKVVSLFVQGNINHDDTTHIFQVFKRGANSFMDIFVDTVSKV